MNQFEYSNGKVQGQTVGHNTKYSCNNVALPYITIGYSPSPRNIKILKIGDGYVIAAILNTA